MMEEIWKDIEGYEGIYQVSSFGRVRSLPKLRLSIPSDECIILKPFISRNGYKMITLTKDGKKHGYTVHRLVALAFVPGFREGKTVNHKDENKLNNHYDNLEWVTYAQNSNYGSRNKRIRDKHIEDAKPVNMYSLDGEFIRTFDSIKEAARFVGTDKANIQSNLKGRTKYAKGFIWKFKK